SRRLPRRGTVREARFPRGLGGVDAQLRVLLEEADASVPAQDGIVVSSGARGHRLLVPMHRLGEEPGNQTVVGAGTQLRLSPPLADHARVVSALVLPAQLRQHLARLLHAATDALAELV